MRTIKMKPIWHFGVSLGVAALALLLSIAPAFGSEIAPGVWQEDPDAGDGVATSAQDTVSGPLTAISGDVGEDTDYVDMFKIIAGSSTITATETVDTSGVLYFLFEAAGYGVRSSTLNQLLQTELTATGLTVGATYYLAIAAPLFQPFDEPDKSDLLDKPLPLFDLDTGNPTVGAGPLWSWSDSTPVDPLYSVALTWAQVPEPATLLLLGAGLTGLGAAAWRRRRQ